MRVGAVAAWTLAAVAAARRHTPSLRRSLLQVDLVPDEEEASLEASEEAAEVAETTTTISEEAVPLAAPEVEEPHAVTMEVEETSVVDAPVVETVTTTEAVPVAAIEEPQMEVADPTEEEAPPAVSSDAAPAVSEGASYATLAAEAEELVGKLKAALAQETELLAALNDKLAALAGTPPVASVLTPAEVVATVTTTSSEDEVAAIPPTETGEEAATAENRLLKVATWNMAAINNNPFEYWITYEGDEGADYEKLMDQVSEFLSEPGDKDVLVSEILTDEMVDELLRMLVEAEIATVSDTDLVQEQWTEDLSKRTIVDGVLKDPILGAKRLISMPDRVTNTIQLADANLPPATRPTVINCYKEDLSDVPTWWARWKSFMFGEEIVTSVADDAIAKHPAQMVQKILKSKYPAISQSEEDVSIPLSTLTLAIFDAILVHVMTTVSGDVDWQTLRSNMCAALNEKKNSRTADILESELYASEDVIFLQESSAAFAKLAKSRDLGTELYDVLAPSELDPSRDQNSLILLKRGAWTAQKEVTDLILEGLATRAAEKGTRSPAAIGDVCAYEATRVLDGKTYILASFHGDTNGLATIPVVDAVHSYRKHHPSGEDTKYPLLFGLDANTHFSNADPARLAYVGDFADNVKAHKMDTCYGLDASKYDYTTFNARTYLQPQLNKAVKASDKFTSDLVDRNPKDFILFYDDDFSLLELARKDNAGDGTFKRDVMFPTLAFPSDHAITRAVLVDDSYAAAHDIVVEQPSVPPLVVPEADPAGTTTTDVAGDIGEPASAVVDTADPIITTPVVVVDTADPATTPVADIGEPAELPVGADIVVDPAVPALDDPVEPAAVVDSADPATTLVADIGEPADEPVVSSEVAELAAPAEPLEPVGEIGEAALPAVAGEPADPAVAEPVPPEQFQEEETIADIGEA